MVPQKKKLKIISLARHNAKLKNTVKQIHFPHHPLGIHSNGCCPASKYPAAIPRTAWICTISLHQASVELSRWSPNNKSLNKDF